LKIQTFTTISPSLLSGTDESFENLRELLNQVCSQVASRFNLYGADGEPRKAAIVDTLAKSSCLACITKKLSKESAHGNIDALYLECHTLAVNLLVEKLCKYLREIGYNVEISTEAELDYGKADIIIKITSYGMNLKCCEKELMVEVKTGKSLSLSQLFRYLLQDSRSTIVVWRIRNRQVLVFKAQEIEPLLTEFVRMTCLRAGRLLSSPTPTTCQHRHYVGYRPSQEELQEMFQDFAKSIIETLPYILEAITERLEVMRSKSST